ncbi:MAG: hypothetical protein GJU76_02795, partial [Gallionella sp.]|nr:hypothetical protein [Gallionella sp.]
MSMHAEIANRHLLPATGLNFTPNSDSQLVRILVPEQWAFSRAGQLLVSCLVNLLVRQVKLVREIEIVSPSAPSLLRTPSGLSLDDFPACLVPLSFWAVDGAVGVTCHMSSLMADHTIYVGGVAGDHVP